MTIDTAQAPPAREKPPQLPPPEPALARPAGPAAGQPVLPGFEGAVADAPPRRSLWWVWLIVIAVLAGVGYFAYPKLRGLFGKDATKAEKPATRPVPVITGKSRKGDMNLYLVGLGSVSPLHTVVIRTRVDGQLNKVAFTEGQVVKEGDLLAEIDPRPFQVQLEQAEGQMAKDQSILKNAQADLQRDLEAKEAISAQQLETQRATVAQAEAATKIDQAMIDNAKLQLTYSRVTAPISGRIGLRTVDQGNIVHANDANGLAVITQLQPIAVIFSLPEDNIPEVMKRMNESAGKLAVDAFTRDRSSNLATGTLQAIDSQIDSGTGTVRFKALFANEKYELFPNQFVNVRLLVNTLHDTVIVPAAAVQQSPDFSYVYVVKPDDTAEMRQVEVGPSESDETAIYDGLKPGETVVTDGVDKLLPGGKVSTGRGGPGGGPGGKPGGGGNGPSSRPATRPVGAPAGAGGGRNKPPMSSAPSGTAQ